MNFLTSLKTCFQKFSDFKGRASRSEFWYFYLFSMLGTYGSIILGIQMPLFFALGVIFGFIILVPALAVTARRLHDTGKSGWWQLTAYIPYVGLIAAIILIVIWCTEGEKKKNKYGKPIKLKR
tara:strand:+ start:467 stop:835 length:369 start_codon:yes stop_codon:yes gene_type:complete